MTKKTSYTLYQKLTDIFSAAVIVSTGVGLILYWQQIADKIPFHYNAAGKPDAWNDKNMLLFLIAIEGILYLGITVLSFFPKIWNLPATVSQGSRELVISKTRTMVCTMKLLLVIGFSYILFCSAVAIPLSRLFLAFMLIAVIGNMVYYFIKTVQISLQDARNILKQKENE